jgi:NADPH2:quinone reductase
VIAVSGRPEHELYLRALGAADVKTPETLQLGTRALESARYGGVIDNVGGGLLSALLRHVHLWGNVVAVGNAGGPEFEATVFPFILRGVSLLGASSANCPMPLRAAVWRRLGGTLKPRHLAHIATRTIRLEEILGSFTPLLERRLHGRVLVECR